MKVNKAVQSAFAATISSSMLLSPLHASTEFWDDFVSSSMLNVTQGGTIKDKSGRIYYTTSIFFRFGPAFENYEPIVMFSPPKVSYGCGGLSVKGMFIRILGLDRLSLMLKSAGASLAWGIAIGLIYSLPGVSASFSFLNSWAKKIQQLLQNACQSGIKLGMAAGKKIPGLGEEGLLQNAFDSFKESTVDALDNWGKSLASAWGFDKAFDDNMVLNFGDDTSLSTADKQRLYESALINHLLVLSPEGNLIVNILEEIGKHNKINNFIKNLFGKDVAQIKPFDTRKLILTYNKSGKSGDGEMVLISISDLLSNYGLFSSSESKRNSIAHAIFSTAIGVSLGGSVGIDQTKKSQKTLTDFLNKAYEDISVSGDINEDEVKKVIADIAQGKYGVISTAPVGAVVKNDNLAEALVNFFWYGTSNPQVSDSMWKVLEKVPAVEFLVVAMPDPENPTIANKKDFLFLPVGEKNFSFFDRNSMGDVEGAVERSKELIEKYINATSSSESSFEPITSGSDMIFLVPDIFDKIRIIQESPKNKREELINALAQYNAYHVVKEAFHGIAMLTSETSVKVPAIHVNGDVVQAVKAGNIESENLKGRKDDYRKAINKLAGSISGLYSEMRKQLDNIILDNDFVKSPHELEKMFREQDIRNKQTVIKHLQ